MIFTPVLQDAVGISTIYTVEFLHDVEILQPVPVDQYIPASFYRGYPVYGKGNPVVQLDPEIEQQKRDHRRVYERQYDQVLQKPVRGLQVFHAQQGLSFRNKSNHKFSDPQLSLSA